MIKFPSTLHGSMNTERQVACHCPKRKKQLEIRLREHKTEESSLSSFIVNHRYKLDGAVWHGAQLKQGPSLLIAPGQDKEDKTSCERLITVPPTHVFAESQQGKKIATSHDHGGCTPPDGPPAPPAAPDPAAIALAQLQDLLARLGPSDDQRDALIATHGIVSVNDLMHLTAKDTRDTCKDLAARTAVDGRVNFGIVSIKRLQALRTWCRDEINQRGSVDPDRFTQQELNEAIDRFNAIDEKDEETPERPPTLVVGKWPTEKERMMNCLFMLRNIDNVPLTHVIRPDPVPGAPTPTERMQLLVATARHAGAAWTQDNQRVHGILKHWALRTDAHEHIRSVDNSRNGREAWLALAVHCDGEGFAK